MNYKLSFILIACSTFSNAQSIHIQSSATPEGISLEKYNQLTSSMNQSNEERAKSKTMHTKRKADEQLREKAHAAAKAKADAANKAKADAANKAKADAKRKAQAQAQADAKRKADLEPEIEAERSSTAQKANEAATIKKAEAKKITSSAKRDFENKIKNAWIIPENASGQKATARITLTDSGAVASIIVNSSNPEIKSSIEQAIRFAAPFPMPSDPDAKAQARSFTTTFTVK